MMRGFVVAILFLSCACGALGNDSLDRGLWLRHQRVDTSSGAEMDVTLALYQPGGHLLEPACQAVSDPSSPKYGSYLTVDEVDELVGARTNAQAVVRHLRHVGATAAVVGATGDMVYATLPSDLVERLFDVKLHVFIHATTGEAIVRANSVGTLPFLFESRVEVVLGVWDFPLVDTRVRSQLREQDLGLLVERAQREARAAAATQGPAFVPAPSLSALYTSSTTVSMQTMFFCGGSFSPANTTIPCSNTDSPVQYVEAKCQTRGSAPFTTRVPMSDVEAYTPGSLFGFTQYSVIVPHTFAPFSFVNCSLRASVNNTLSKWVSLPYFNVTAADQYVVMSPSITPVYLSEFYGYRGDTVAGGGGATQAVAEFELQFYAQKDLDAFYSEYGVNETGSLSVTGLNIPLGFTEASLDIEWITAVAPFVDTVFYSNTIASNTSQPFVLKWAAALNEASSPPLVNSVSYGATEAQITKAYGTSYISRTNAEFLKLCTRGVTVVIASGDAGATNDGHGTSECTVMPTFPASSPWVTSVSATFVDKFAPPRAGNPDKLGESLVSVEKGMFWTTGGGFSNAPSAPRPWYQDAAVKQYLATAPAADMPLPSMFNATNRACSCHVVPCCAVWMVAAAHTRTRAFAHASVCFERCRP